MILTLTANPCIDKTLSLERLELYKMNRARVIDITPSGKGINVSKALRLLGVETVSAAFDFSMTDSSRLREALDTDGIPHELVGVYGELRVCSKIFDKSRAHTVEINEVGTPVTVSDGERLIDALCKRAVDADILTLSGSIPSGLGTDFYRLCTERARQVNPDIKVIADAEGELLLEALKAAPFMIKPNIHELESTFGCHADGIESLDRIALDLIDRYGIHTVCISLGADGAFIATSEEAYFCRPYDVTVRSLQGAGDAMVAGICYAVEEGLPLADMLKYGACCAGASVAVDGTQFCTREEFFALLDLPHEVKRIR